MLGLGLNYPVEQSTRGDRRVTKNGTAQASDPERIVLGRDAMVSQHPNVARSRRGLDSAMPSTDIERDIPTDRTMATPGFATTASLSGTKWI